MNQPTQRFLGSSRNASIVAWPRDDPKELLLKNQLGIILSQENLLSSDLHMPNKIFKQ